MSQGQSQSQNQEERRSNVERRNNLDRRFDLVERRLSYIETMQTSQLEVMRRLVQAETKYEKEFSSVRAEIQDGVQKTVLALAEYAAAEAVTRAANNRSDMLLLATCGSTFVAVMAGVVYKFI